MQENNKGTGFKVEGWRDTVVSSVSTIKQAISSLDKTGMKIVLIVDDKDEFIGTISDGDIRRGLLKGLDLSSSLSQIINRKALVVPQNMPKEAVEQLMFANKIHQIPIVDGKYLKGLHLWDRITSLQLRKNMMVVMAGGRGVRLMPHTENVPKPMVIVSGKPILEHIILRGKLEGFQHFVLAIHHLGHVIEDYFGTGEKFGVKIDYLREKSPLGTAGALSLLKPIPHHPFLVTNGDVITNTRYGDLLDFHERHEAIATMGVRVHEYQNPFGVVKMKGLDIVGFEEKPIVRTNINGGIYVLSPEALDELEQKKHCDMPTLFERIQAKAKRTVAYPIHEQWLDVGKPDDLLHANAVIK